MNTKTLAIVLVAALIMAGGLFAVRAADETKALPDQRIDKLLEQNEKILKNQDEILKQLGDLKQDMVQLRRRSS